MLVRKLVLPLLLALVLLLSAGCASGDTAAQGEVLIRNTAGLGKTTTYRLQEIAPAALTAALFYQGEEDTGKTDRYDVLLTAMIRYWRKLYRNAQAQRLSVHRELSP